MKIFEIDDSDRAWAALQGISFDIDQYFTEANNILDMLIKLKSQHRNNIWLPNIDIVEEKLTRIANANLANDVSSKELKDKSQRYLAEINRLKGLL